MFSWWAKTPWLIALLIGLTACASEPTLVPLPTLTLVQIAPTATPIPTATPEITTPLPQPGDIRALQATPRALDFIVPPPEDISPDADTLVSARDDLSRYLSIDNQRVQMVTLTRDNLYHADFACPQPPHLSAILANFQQYATAERYRLTLLVGMTIYTYHIVPDQILTLCYPTQPVTDELLFMVDPIASELTRLAQRRLAQELDLPQMRMQLVALTAHTWTDTSLGCPQPNQTYDAIQVEGYRIVLQAGDRNYSFHTDASSIFACPQGRERIP